MDLFFYINKGPGRSQVLQFWLKSVINKRTAGTENGGKNAHCNL